jgi:hypothetical protein
MSDTGASSNTGVFIMIRLVLVMVCKMRRKSFP